MYSIIVLLSIAACLNTVYSAVGILRPVDKPKEFADQEGCYVPKLNKVLPYKTTFSPQDGKSCVQYTCRTNNYTSLESCGALGVSAGYKIVPGDKFLPYPDCCDKIAKE